MFFRSRRRSRRLLSLVVALAVQTWSLAPVSASVIYCIGDDGHAGFELVVAGARGCADCCHGPEEAGRETVALSAVRAAPAEAVSECTDIAMSAAQAVKERGAAGADFDLQAAALIATPASPVAFEAAARPDPDPGRASPCELRRSTVLQI